MRVTIHQPEHFPYMGLFQKVAAAETFVILDNVNFRKNYFQNRNKIPLKNGEDAWITVPVEKKATSKHIKDVQVSQDPTWKRKLLAKIHQNLPVDVEEIYEGDMLIDINMKSIRWGMDKLKMTQKILFASELGVEGHKSELLANILRAVGATTYISGPSGKDYLEMYFFEGIDVEFFEPKVDNYYSCLYNLTKEKECH